MTTNNQLTKYQTGDAEEIAVTNAAVPLDRKNLEFFAGMIEHAGLIPQEKESNGQPMAISKAKARVMAKIVGGAVYRFDPIQAQENLHIINGKLTLSARGMSQLLHRSGKYTTRQVYIDQTGCKLAVLKRSEQTGEFHLIGHVEFTKEMAEKAGLTKNPNYQKFAADMFFARCITRVVKRFAPEVLDGQSVSYDLARRETSEPTPAPQQIPAQSVAVEAPTPQYDVGDVVEDIAYVETETLAEAFANDEQEGEFVPVEESAAPDNEEADNSSPDELTTRFTNDVTSLLRLAAENRIAEMTGGDEKEVKKLLKGRQLDMMSADALRVLIGDLEVF